MLRLTLKLNCYLNVKFNEYVMLIFTLTENSDTTFPIVYWLIRVKRLLEDACVNFKYYQVPSYFLAVKFL